MLLNEVGVYVESESILKTSEVSGAFAQDFVENIATISAGITKLEVLDEKWDGDTFWMKARITVDPKSLEESLRQISQDRKRIKELEDVKLQLDKATKELDRIRKTLSAPSAESNRSTPEELTEKYDIQIKSISSADFYLSGREKFNNQDFLGAIEDYTKSIQLDQKNNQSYGGRGFAKYALQKYQEAIVDFNLAIEACPRYADAYYSLRGLSKANLEDYRGSIEDFSKAYAIDPKFSEAVCNRGTSKSALKNYAGAVDDYTLAIKINPKYSSAYFKRGLLRISHLNQKESGCLDLSKAGELGENYAYSAIQDLCK